MTGRLDRARPLLCFIHDADRAEIPEGLRAVAPGAWEAVDLVQVRGKGLAGGALEALAGAWLDRLEGVATRVVVNDRLDAAVAGGAHGVHLGRADLPVEAARELAPEGFLIGASTRSRDEILAAQAAGADYAGLGAFFPTPTKDDAVALDPARLAGRDSRITIPVLAIGGITAARVAEVMRVPAVTGVAVSGAVQRAADAEAAIGRLRKALDEAWEARAAPARVEVAG